MMKCQLCTFETRWLDGEGRCETCIAAEDAISNARAQTLEVLGDLDARLERLLLEIGLSKRETTASRDRIPTLIARALPKDRIEPLAKGEKPQGWGLGSDTGTGKTMAVASMLKEIFKKRIQAHVESYSGRVEVQVQARRAERQEIPRFILTLGSAIPSTAWLSWPDTVARIRAHALAEQTESLLIRAMEADLLILDDLGRERIKGLYIDDWAASQLDRIVNHRYREMLPTIWTTNLTEKTLVGLYGAAMVSRLTEDNPLTWISNLSSLRVK